MDLEEIRRGINRLDEQMKEIFLERMMYCAQVAEIKKQTGGRVFVPEREQEILRLRMQGVDEELAWECRSFFQQIIGISRTYQYSKLVKGEERLLLLPEGEGEVVLEFSCGSESEMLASVFNAAALAGLTVKEMEVFGCRTGAFGGKVGLGEDSDGAQISDGGPGQTLEPKGRLHCRLGLAGDFSGMSAKAAVLQILEETEEAVLLPAGM